ncbi:MAG TPA: penicillin-binding protein [Chitinophagaceae bacterium]|nr:penicillin-binding protein [Chitinophagaceae bacterium]
MEVKKDILWRVYLCFLGMMAFGLFILSRVFIIQDIQGKYWKSMADSLHTRYVTIDAGRGNIYSDNGSMLCTSIPYFNIRMDMGEEGLREKDGQVFLDHVDSLSDCLSALFRDKSATQYKRELMGAWNRADRYFLVKREVTYSDFQKLKGFPVFRLGPDKGGLVAEPVEKRINPFRLLANRTVGLWRENAQNVGLEATYNKDLSGVTGRRLMRRIAGGTYIPVDGYQIDPENGKDIVTNLDVNIQDIAENALYRMVSSNEAQHGTCIVMEVKTGKIRAIANLGRQPDGSYAEDYNYGVGVSAEPGSVFKLALMISLLQDKLISLQDTVFIANGSWKYGKRTMYDAESHHQGLVTIKQAFEMSSNVGISKLAYRYYEKDPYKYLHHIHLLRLDTLTGVDLAGEAWPVVKNPKSRTWSATSLPWMSIGYEVQVTPLQILNLYNSVANGGTMMRPYLVSAVTAYGKPVQEFEPRVLIPSICSDTVLASLRELLEGVVKDKVGTANQVFQGAPYQAAGKTGTALVANGSHGYADKIYQATFVGYFPADDPVYSCIVVIKNKPHAAKYYGASVAAPVFREVADRLYALGMQQAPVHGTFRMDSALVAKSGSMSGEELVLSRLGIPFSVASSPAAWANPVPSPTQVALKPQLTPEGLVPNVAGMGLKDALQLLEQDGLEVTVAGTGKVYAQSIPAGDRITKGSHIRINLD